MTQAPRVHSFRRSMAAAETPEIEAFWEAAYARKFPTKGGILRNKRFGQGQRDGIDTVICLANGQIFKIEEKIRHTAYPDILLEYVSQDNVVPPVPGWIEKPLQVDFLAYGIYPTRQVYFFPWALLKAAWDRYGVQWKREHRQVVAKNPTYNSLSVAVPIAVVVEAVREAAVDFYALVQTLEEPVRVAPVRATPAAPIQATPAPSRRRTKAERDAEHAALVATKTAKIERIVAEVKAAPRQPFELVQGQVDDLFPPEI